MLRLIFTGQEHYIRIVTDHAIIYSPPPRCHAVNMRPGSPFYSLCLHLKYGHRPISHLQSMIDGRHIKVPKGHLKKLALLPGPCPVCVIGGATKLPRSPCVDMTELPVGTRWHLDFSFFNTRSVCGFNASLTVIDASSRMLFEFQCRNKRPLIDIVGFFFDLQKRQGYPCVAGRVDKGGKLARSEEFMMFMKVKVGMLMETTGGDNSTNNGKTESPH